MMITHYPAVFAEYREAYATGIYILQDCVTCVTNIADKAQLCLVKSARVRQEQKALKQQSGSAKENT